eukprot:GHVR01128338.1.p1 GENE.GHVR01128338.1~~GHVR01128338.1.p1  ORF type:complete len:227 (+),score=43.10 GHVR01128338.1:85-765(+)
MRYTIDLLWVVAVLSIKSITSTVYYNNYIQNYNNAEELFDFTLSESTRSLSSWWSNKEEEDSQSDYKQKNKNDGTVEYRGTYQGCYKFNIGQRDEFSTILFNNVNMNNEMCVKNCAQIFRTYSATYNGSNCACGDDLTLPKSNNQSSSCSIKCVGSVTEACGGTNDASIYETGIVGQPAEVAVISESEKKKEIEPIDFTPCDAYQGCYRFQQKDHNGYVWLVEEME